MKHKNISIFIPNAGCKQLCSFCNQSDISGSIKVPSVQEVSTTLNQAVSQLVTSEERMATEIAFFGGSFTAIGKHQQEEYLKLAHSYVREYGLHGIRISTRPDAIDTDILDTLKLYGVTSIELGAQSMDDTVLAANRRGHTSEAVDTASKLIHSYSISLGLQMMVGLYKSTPELEFETIERLIACKPDTMRIYPTVVLEGTELAALMKSGLYLPMGLEAAVKICGGLLLRCHQAGIKVIKLGLHASEQVEAKTIGGAYHPALRELCEGELYFLKTLDTLRKYKSGAYEVSVSPSCISKMIGQKKNNIIRLADMGYTVKVLSDTSIGQYEIALKEVAACS